MSTSPAFTGLIAAPCTPMRPDGSLKLDLIESLAAQLQADGVSGVFVNGTTGEGMSLSVEERLQIAERWLTVAANRFPVVVHVGHTALPDCRRLAKHAQKHGARAIAAIGPCFFRPNRIPDLVRFCAEIASAAPELPFYYYHIPSVSGVYLPMTEFLQTAGATIPTLAGMKFTYEDLAEFARCLRLENGRFNMLFGRDEMLLAALALGARGAVGSTYNFAAPIYRKIIAAFQAGDLPAAQAHQDRATRMIAIATKFGLPQAWKAIMSLIGLDCGPTRPPLPTLSPNDISRLRDELSAVGFFDWARR